MSPVLCPCSGWAIDEGMSRPKNGHHPNCELADDEEDTLLFEEQAVPTAKDNVEAHDAWLARIATEYREWFTYHGSRPELSGVAAVVEFGFERMQQAQGVMPADAAELVVENARLRTELAKHQPPPDPVERVTE